MRLLLGARRLFNKRYSTRTIAEAIDLDIQLCLWGLIDKWKKQNSELDYLQVFELSIVQVNDNSIQKIVHWQEQPAIKQEAYFQVCKPIEERLWVVANDEENAVLMFPEEY